MRWEPPALATHSRNRVRGTRIWPARRAERGDLLLRSGPRCRHWTNGNLREVAGKAP